MNIHHNDNQETGASPPLIPAMKAFSSIGVGRTRAYEMLNAGMVVAVKVGNSTMIRRDDWARFLADLPTYPVKAA